MKKVFLLFTFILLSSGLFFFAKKINSQISGSVNVSVNLPDWPPIINFSVIPEKRIPLTGNNSTNAVLEVRELGTTNVLVSFSPLITDNNGDYTGLTLTSIIRGNYDLVIKGYSHLKKKLTVNGLLPGDYNSKVEFGTVLIGDVKITAMLPNGDNQVNSLDMGYLVSQWGTGDTGVSENRSDVDENGIVNSLDMGKVIANYGLNGD